MSCKGNVSVGHGRGGTYLTNRILNCGFSAGWAKFTCLPKRETAVESSVKHIYPVQCPPTKVITISRIDTIIGVDNAVFAVGDCEGGYRQGKNYTVIHLPSMMKTA